MIRMGLRNIVKLFARYSSVAFGSAVIDWIVFIIIHQLGFSYFAAQAVSRISGGGFSFLTNRYWTFSSGKKRHITVQGRRFILLYMFSYVASLSMLYFLVDIMGVSIYYSKFASDTICFVLNYVLMQSYVYHNRRGVLMTTNDLLRGITKTNKTKV